MADEQQQRSSGASARSSVSRSKQNPQQQLSTIEKSVTHLLVATKQLLETLTEWSRGEATEGAVSDVYVRLGYEFNIACRAFAAIGVETSDLGPVPEQLRTILEDTLSQEASQASLDKYLPKIRDIIIGLLHGLKKKQQRLRQKGGGGGGGGGSTKDAGATVLPPRQGSVTSNTSGESTATQQLDDGPSRTASSRSFAQRPGNGEITTPDPPPRTSSVAGGRQSPRRSNASLLYNTNNAASSVTPVSDGSAASSISSNAMQNIPVIAPYPESDMMPTGGDQNYDVDQPSPEAPPPPPKQNDALSALQKGGDLERRASRRFSAYQIQKHLGTSMNGIAAIPPAQNSPIPNRGRDKQESLSAVRSRGSVLHSRARSKNQGTFEPSPNRLAEVRRISEEPSADYTPSTELPPPPTVTAPDDQLDSPTVKTPEDKLAAYPFPDAPRSPDKFGATINGPVDEHFAPDLTYVGSTSERKKPTAAPARAASRRHGIHTPPPPQFVPDSSPQPGKELTLFLQYKSKIRKFVLSDGGDLSLARLQLAFIEKFAWNTQNNGADLPEIYIQDPISGVRHELEDLSDIKERSVLVLNVEELGEVKRHIDDGIGGLRRIIEGIRSSVDDQQSALQRVSDRQQETVKELAGIAAAPVSASIRPTTGSRTLSSKDKAGQLSEVQSLRRDLAVIKQTYSSFAADMNASMTVIRSKAAVVKNAAAELAVPDLDSNSGRHYVDNGKKTLSEDSEKIVNRVDDLQDLVEDLRKDVVARGVRPLPRQLETVSKDISTATADLKKLQDFLKREKPIWTKIWEKELQVVCDDRDLLTLQEELAVDLEDDLDKAAATFALVEQATKQQNLQNPQAPSGGPGGGATAGTTAAGAGRSTSRTLKPLALDHTADPQKAKDGVLGEVRALQPNHESRLEAIERAERARQRELDSRKGGEFERELGSFVEEGKLKKTGGVEEVERMRKLREDSARKEVLERQQQRMRERAERDAAAATAAVPVASGEVPDGAPTVDNNSIANGIFPEIHTAEAGEISHEIAPPASSLEIPLDPHDGGERESSPEPRFVDAKEDVGSPYNNELGF